MNRSFCSLGIFSWIPGFLINLFGNCRDKLFRALKDRRLRPNERLTMNFPKNIGMLLLAIYLILVGLATIFGLGVGYIAGIVALIAGIFILIGR